MKEHNLKMLIPLVSVSSWVRFVAALFAAGPTTIRPKWFILYLRIIGTERFREYVSPSCVCHS